MSFSYLLSDLWERKFLELKTYYHTKRQHDNDSIYVDNAPLGRWVQQQRRFYKRNRLSARQIQALDSIGFSWKGTKKTEEPVTPRLIHDTDSSISQFPAMVVEFQKEIGNIKAEKFLLPKESLQKAVKQVLKAAAGQRKDGNASMSSEVEWPSSPSIKENRTESAFLKSTRNDDASSSCCSEEYEWTDDSPAFSSSRAKPAVGPLNSTNAEECQSLPSSDNWSSDDGAYLREGTRISVYWDDDDYWFGGTIMSSPNSAGKVKIWYDDGVQDFIRLNEDKWSLSMSLNRKKEFLLKKLRPNTRLKIWFPVEKEYFEGSLARIESSADEPHFIEYDDGEDEQCNLMRKKFQRIMS